jgi:hypothetical protein
MEGPSVEAVQLTFQEQYTHLQYNDHLLAMLVATTMPYKGRVLFSFLLAYTIIFLLVLSLPSSWLITQPDFQICGDLALGNSVPRPKHDLQWS